MIVDVLLPVLAIVLLVAANGLFVAAEFALVGARRSRLQMLADGGSRAAQWLMALTAQPAGKDRYVAVAQLGITLASIGLGMYGEPAVAAWLYPPFEAAGLSVDLAHVVGFVVALSAITYLHVVFGEMIPKAMALQSPEAVITRVNTPMRVFGLLMRPMVAVLNYIALRLMHLLGIRDPDAGSLLHTSRELAILTGEVADSGQLGALQRSIIDGLLELEDTTAGELMTPRSRVQSLALSTPHEEIARLIVASSISRYPVHDEAMERARGLLHVKDFIRARASGERFELRSLLRPLPEVADSLSATGLLALFKRERTHAALVVDEFGGTLGLVTLDDLIADVIDDEDANPGSIVARPDGSYSVDGEVTLQELQERHGIVLPAPESGQVNTVAGLVMACHGTLPQQGEAVDAGNWTLVVEAVARLKITRVLLKPSGT